MDKPRCALSVWFGIGAGIFLVLAPTVWESTGIVVLAGLLASLIETYRSNRQNEKNG